MIEEQPGVEVVGEVDEELVAALAHLELLAARRLPAVLPALGGALPPSLLEVHVGGGDAEHLGHEREDVAEALLGARRIDRRRRRVLLHVRRGLVEVDGDGVLDEIGVVDAPAVHVLARRPLLAMLEVLAQAVGERLAAHCRARAHRRLRAPSSAMGNSSRRHSIAPLKRTWRRAARRPMRFCRSGFDDSTNASQPVKRWRRTLPICS